MIRHSSGVSIGPEFTKTTSEKFLISKRQRLLSKEYHFVMVQCFFYFGKVLIVQVSYLNIEHLSTHSGCQRTSLDMGALEWCVPICLLLVNEIHGNTRLD